MTIRIRRRPDGKRQPESTATPRIPGMLLRAVSRAHREHLAGDLAEEYVTYVLPRAGRFRARLWLWRRLFLAVFFSFAFRLRAKVGSVVESVRLVSLVAGDGDTALGGLGALLYDVRDALRGLRRHPVFTAVAVLTLALGVGGSVAVFSVVNGVLIRPLPFPDQDRLVMLWQRAPGIGVDTDWFSAAQYFDLRERASSFEALAVFGGIDSTVTGNGAEAERAGVLYCSSSFFGVLGITTALGRPLLPEDDVPGSAQKVVLSHRMFKERFGGDAAVIGAAITLDGNSLEVVGVLPELVLDAELFPTMERVPRFEVIASLPVPDLQVTAYGTETFGVLGKLRPDATESMLESELAAVAASFAEDPGSLAGGLSHGDEYRIAVVPLLEQVAGNARRFLLVLLGAAGLLFVTACVNVANLLLTRTAAESRQLAIRAALGVGRRRIVAQSMIGSLTLALLGGLAGLVIAIAGLRALHILAPTELPRLREVSVDPSVLLFAAIICLGSSLVFGTSPALRSASVDPGEVLNESGGPARPTRSVWRRRGASYLVMLQVALSVMLLIGAGLLVRTMWQLRTVDPGFRPEGVLSFRLSFVGPGYEDPDARVMLLNQLWEQLSGLPGVRSAGGVALLPMTEVYAWTDFTVEGRGLSGQRDRIVADEQFVTPGYFETMEISLLAGRDFVAEDGDDPPVVIVDRSFSESFWTEEEAIGKWVIGYPSGKRATVVGVVDGTRHYDLAADPRLTVFYPYRFRPVSTLYGTVRVDGDPTTLAPLLLDTVAELDPHLPIGDVRPVSALVADSLSQERLLVFLLSLFSGVAVTLAAVGLYAVLSFSVAAHTHELGVRMALGACRQDLYRLVLRRARVVTFAGIGLGAAGAFAVGNAFEGLVYGVSTADPLSFGAAVLLVAGVAWTASSAPARRAARVDPMVALKAY